MGDPAEASTTSDLHPDFSLDDVRTRLHGQLEIQPISQPSSTFHPGGGNHQWIDNYNHHQRPSRTDDVISKAIATSSNEILGDSNGNNGLPEEDDRLPHHYQKLRKMDDHHRPSSIPPHLQQHHPHSHLSRLQSKYDISSGGGGTDLSIHNRRSPYASQTQSPQQHQVAPRPRGRTSRSSSTSAAAAAAAAAVSAASNAAATQLLAAAQAAGMPASALDPSDPMSSMNALLAAAQVWIYWDRFSETLSNFTIFLGSWLDQQQQQQLCLFPIVFRQS